MAFRTCVSPLADTTSYVQLAKQSVSDGAIMQSLSPLQLRSAASVARDNCKCAMFPRSAQLHAPAAPASPASATPPSGCTRAQCPCTQASTCGKGSALQPSVVVEQSGPK